MGWEQQGNWKVMGSQPRGTRSRILTTFRSKMSLKVNNSSKLAILKLLLHLSIFYLFFMPVIHRRLQTGDVGMGKKEKKLRPSTKMETLELQKMN